eukprot:scaffold4868_cov416-Prasinococcus_capsulatus_cf.AAC.29
MGGAFRHRCRQALELDPHALQLLSLTHHAKPRLIAIRMASFTKAVLAVLALSAAVHVRADEDDEEPHEDHNLRWCCVKGKEYEGESELDRCLKMVPILNAISMIQEEPDHQVLFECVEMDDCVAALMEDDDHSDEDEDEDEDGDGDGDGEGDGDGDGDGDEDDDDHDHDEEEHHSDVRPSSCMLLQYGFPCCVSMLTPLILIDMLSFVIEG